MTAKLSDGFVRSRNAEQFITIEPRAASRAVAILSSKSVQAADGHGVIPDYYAISTECLRSPRKMESGRRPLRPVPFLDLVACIIHCGHPSPSGGRSDLRVPPDPVAHSCGSVIGASQEHGDRRISG